MKTSILKIDPHNPEQNKINKIVQVLQKSGIVILPTETVYGVAADYTDKNALDKLYEIKRRPRDKPFSIVIDKTEKIQDFATGIPVLAYKLMDKFWPGPLTLILKSNNNKKVAIRIPKNFVVLRVIETLNNAVALPSANISGNPAPTTMQAALRDLDGLVQLAVDTGPTQLKKESTIVEVGDSKFFIVREGALSNEQIKKVAKTKNILFVCTGNSCRSVMASALLNRELQSRDDVEIASAGILAPLGLGASQEVKDILSQEGIDVSGHLARRITKDLLKKSDVILVMEKMHEKRIIEIVPEVKNRVFLLKEFAKIEETDLDIPDPIGKDKDFYLKVYYTIKEAIKRIAKIV